MATVRRPSRPQPSMQHDEAIIPFTAGDGRPLNLVHVQDKRPPSRGPVLLAHGAGVRANIFCAPVQRNLVDVLLAEGYDVWLENWRASIDLPPTDWNLDQAAAYDHAPAVRTVLEHTSRDTLQAIIHCQGSTSFMMAATAGLLPEVTTVISNAVALHPVVPDWSHIKIRRLMPLLRQLTPALNPEWGDRAPTPLSKVIVAGVRFTHHECDNTVCRMVSFTYGTGHPALWRHENLNDATHDWLRDEFGRVPLTFFDQMSRCIGEGHLISVEHHLQLPASYVAQPPQTKARFAFLAGLSNTCFLPESQRRTFQLFDKHRPGVHALHTFDGYGHLDVFLGARAEEDIFPTILKELEQ
jgi:hypothetical protein